MAKLEQNSIEVPDWKEELLGLLFPPNPGDIKREEGYALKFNHIPSSLFKYRKFSQRSMDNFQLSGEWFSFPYEFNDPFDSGVTIAGINSNIIDKVGDIFRHHLVTCFSESNDDTLMWSHYAEGHTGFCVEYDFHGLGQSTRLQDNCILLSIEIGPLILQNIISTSRPAAAY